MRSLVVNEALTKASYKLLRPPDEQLRVVRTAAAAAYPTPSDATLHALPMLRLNLLLLLHGEIKTVLPCYANRRKTPLHLRRLSADAVVEVEMAR